MFEFWIFSSWYGERRNLHFLVFSGPIPYLAKSKKSGQSTKDLPSQYLSVNFSWKRAIDMNDETIGKVWKFAAESARYNTVLSHVTEEMTNIPPKVAVFSNVPCFVLCKRTNSTNRETKNGWFLIVTFWRPQTQWRPIEKFHCNVRSLLEINQMNDFLCKIENPFHGNFVIQSFSRCVLQHGISWKKWKKMS